MGSIFPITFRCVVSQSTNDDTKKPSVANYITGAFHSKTKSPSRSKKPLVGSYEQERPKI